MLQTPNDSWLHCLRTKRRVACRMIRKWLPNVTCTGLCFSEREQTRSPSKRSTKWSIKLSWMLLVMCGWPIEQPLRRKRSVDFVTDCLLTEQVFREQDWRKLSVRLLRSQMKDERHARKPHYGQLSGRTILPRTRNPSGRRRRRAEMMICLTMTRRLPLQRRRRNESLEWRGDAKARKLRLIRTA